jgi:hypothetical protein
MAQNNKIQIQVEVQGTDQAAKQLNKIEVASEDIQNGVKGVGENFSAVSDIVASSNEKMGAGLAGVGESVIGLTEAFSAFKEAGGSGILGMIGPLSLLVTALGAAYEAWRQFSGAAQEAEDAAENMSAAAGDTAARLEAMVEAGVVLGTEALKDFIKVNERARLAIEQTIKLNEKRTVSDQKVVAATKALEAAESAIFFQESRIAKAKYDLQKATEEYTLALDKQVKSSIEANRLNEEAFKLHELLMAPYDELVSAVRAEREAFDDLNTRLLATSEIRDKDRIAIENSLKRKKELIAEEQRYKATMAVLEDQLKKGIIRQVDFDKTNRAMREGLDKSQKELKAVNDQLKPYVENLEAASEANDKLKALNKEAFSKRNAEDIEALSRKITLLDRILADSRDTATNYGKSFAVSMENMLYRTTEFTREYVKLRSEAERIRSGALLGGSIKQSVQDRLNEIYKISPDFKAEIELGYKDITESLVEIEEQRIDLSWQQRLKEIQGMDISNKKKKQLYAEALKDAEYQTKRVRETTLNTAKARVEDLLVAQQQEDLSRKLAAIEKDKQDKESNLRSKQFLIEQLNTRKAYNSDLIQEVSSIDAEILKIQEGNQLDSMTILLIAQKEQLAAIDLHYQERLYLAKQVNDKVSIDGKRKLDDELKSIREQSRLKTEEIANTERNILNLVDHNAEALRRIELESYVQRQRYARDFSSMFLSDEQIRVNATKEFIEQEYEAKRAVAANTIKIADTQIAKSKEQLAILEAEAKVIQSMLSMYGSEGTNLLEQDINELKMQQEQKALQQSLDMKKKAYDDDSELKRLHNERMYEYDLQHYQEVGGLIKDYAASSSQALISNAVAAAFAGESVADSIRTTIRGLAQEATARALFEGAAALGSLAIGDERGAALHGNSAVAFGLAATTMGVLTAAVGVPGGSSGGAGSTSPSGLSQTSEAPQREAAKSESMVFNINFGNAVIYDTKTAAERAMAERVMQLGQQARRGYNPPRPRI